MAAPFKILFTSGAEVWMVPSRLLTSMLVLKPPLDTMKMPSGENPRRPLAISSTFLYTTVHYFAKSIGHTSFSLTRNGNLRQSKHQNQECYCQLRRWELGKVQGCEQSLSAQSFDQQMKYHFSSVPILSTLNKIS